MLKLLPYLLRYWRWALLAPLLMTVEVICDLLQPHFLSKIIDQGLGSGEMTVTLQWGAQMLIAAVIGVLGGVGCSYFASKAAVHVARDLRNDLFAKVQTFSFANLDALPAPTLITRLTGDVTQIQGFVLMLLRIMVRAPLLCIGGVVMALLIDPLLALTSLGAIPLLAVVLVFVVRRGFPLFAVVQKRLDGVYTVMRETLSGIRVVKAFVRSEYEGQRFERVNEDLTATSLKANRVVGTTTPIMMVLMNLSIVLLLWSGGYRVNSGELQIGQIMALVNYVMQILFSLMMSAMLLMAISRAQASAKRIIEVLETPTEGDKPRSPMAWTTPGDRGPLVEFRKVTFRYPGGRGSPVLNSVSLSLFQGQTLAILGSTGSGKTSLVSLIPRFYDPEEGQVLWGGTDLKTLDPGRLRSEIGFVLQESILFSGPILDNLRWGYPQASDEEIFRAAQIAQADQFIQALPQGCDTVLGQRGVNLSGGQKQRLCLARALVRKPRLLIMDDSTSAVDLETEARIQKGLKESLAQTACILIAQRISSVMDADQIAVLEEGRIVSMGTHEQLLSHSPVYQEIYRSQMGKEAS